MFHLICRHEDVWRPPTPAFFPRRHRQWAFSSAPPPRPPSRPLSSLSVVVGAGIAECSGGWEGDDRESGSSSKAHFSARLPLAHVALLATSELLRQIKLCTLNRGGIAGDA